MTYIDCCTPSLPAPPPPCGGRVRRLSHRLLRLTLATALSLSLVGCFRDTPQEPNEPPDPINLQVEATAAGNITDLGTLGSNYSIAKDINSNGLIVGYSQITTNGAIHAFYWQNDRMTDMGTLGGAESQAEGVGEGGQIVGSSGLPEPCYDASNPNAGVSAFVWQTGIMSALSRLPGGCGSEASAINTSSQIVGFSWEDRNGDGSTHQRPVMWHNGVLRDLGSSDDIHGRANDINENGQVVGQSGNHAFLWQSGVMRDLGTLGGVFSEAEAINGSGEIVGTAMTSTGATHAVMWRRNGTIVDMGTLGGSSSYAHDINDNLQVVGHSRTATGHFHAVVWQDGVMTDLGTLGGENDYAYAINQTGQVVGTSATPDGSLHAVRWRIPTSDFWSSRKQLPSSREGHAVTTAGGLVYTIGGLASRSQPIRTVQSYKPGSNIWNGKAPLPAARYSGNGAAMIAGTIYVAGGLDAAGVLTRTLYAYQTSTDAWSTRANMPVFSGCGGSAVISGKLYVFSGCTRSSTGNQVPARLLHRYDPGTNSWAKLSPAPGVHSQPAVGAIGGKVYVVGGNNFNGVTVRRLDVYDPATNTWTTRAPPPTARVAAAGAVVAGKLYVVGGRNGTTYLNTLEVYDPVTDSWLKKASIPAARAGLGVGVIDNLLYAIGGRYENLLLKANERYTP